MPGPWSYWFRVGDKRHRFCLHTGVSRLCARSRRLGFEGVPRSRKRTRTLGRITTPCARAQQLFERIKLPSSCKYVRRVVIIITLKTYLPYCIVQVYRNGIRRPGPFCPPILYNESPSVRDHKTQYHIITVGTADGGVNLHSLFAFDVPTTSV